MGAKTLILLVLAAAAVVVAATAVGARRALVAPTTEGFEDVNFVTLCSFSHRAPDDPIVHPGHPNLSHDHTFFGSTETDAFSTPQSLRGRPTTCSRADDTAAYWAPTLLVNDKPVDALDAAAYYRRTTFARVKPFPPNLVMIAGDANAQQAQSMRVVFWNCALEATSPSTTVPDCGTNNLRLHVIFPECWDGKRLDSVDHKSHMAYAVNGTCPASHPVAVPQLVLVIRYPVNGTGTVELASHGELSGHADFVNAWSESGLRHLVDYCLNALRPCGTQS